MTLNGCSVSEDLEVEDNATTEEIDAIVREEALNYVSWGWVEKTNAG